LHKTNLEHVISLFKIELKYPTAVALAQARHSSPGERPSRLGESVSPERGSNSGKN